MRIDAHHHFWRLDRGDYSWLTPEMKAIYRDFQPDDLQPLLAENNIDGTVLVQAAPTVAETRFMMSLAERCPFIKAVVGWVDFEAPDVADQISSLVHAYPVLAGLRPMIQDIADPEWMLRPALSPAFDALQKHDLTFDALTLPVHLKYLHKLIRRYPDMRIVIDHASKPAIRDRLIQEWAEDMTLISEESVAFCKLSGLITEAGANWRIEDLRPYVEHLLATFGPDRLIWGSDWPVCHLAGSYKDWLQTTEHLLGALCENKRNAIFGGAAMNAYKLRK